MPFCACFCFSLKAICGRKRFYSVVIMEESHVMAFFPSRAGLGVEAAKVGKATSSARVPEFNPPCDASDCPAI